MIFFRRNTFFYRLLIVVILFWEIAIDSSTRSLQKAPKIKTEIKYTYQNPKFMPQPLEVYVETLQNHRPVNRSSSNPMGFNNIPKDLLALYAARAIETNSYGILYGRRQVPIKFITEKFGSFVSPRIENATVQNLSQGLGLLNTVLSPTYDITMNPKAQGLLDRDVSEYTQALRKKFSYPVEISDKILSAQVKMFFENALTDPTVSKSDKISPDNFIEKLKINFDGDGKPVSQLKPWEQLYLTITAVKEIYKQNEKYNKYISSIQLVDVPDQSGVRGGEGLQLDKPSEVGVKKDSISSGDVSNQGQGVDKISAVISPEKEVAVHYEPIVIPKVDTIVGDKSSLLTCFGLHVQEPIYWSSGYLKSISSNKTMDVATIKKETPIDSVIERYLEAHGKDFQKAFILLHKDIEQLNIAIKSESSQAIRKGYEAVVDVAQQAAHKLNETIVSRQVQKLVESINLSNQFTLDTAIDIYSKEVMKIKKELRSYSSDAVQTIVNQQYLQISEQVLLLLKDAESIIKNIQLKISQEPPENFDQYIKSRTFETLLETEIQSKLSQNEIARFKDIIVEKIKNQLEVNNMKEKQEIDKTIQGRNIADTIWQNYRDSSGRKDLIDEQIKILQKELADKSLTKDQQDLMNTLVVQQDITSAKLISLKASMMEINANGQNAATIASIIQKTIDAVTELQQSNPIKQAFKDLKKDLQEAIGKKLSDKDVAAFDKIEKAYTKKPQVDSLNELKKLFKNNDDLTQPQLGTIVEKYITTFIDLQMKIAHDKDIRSKAAKIGTELLHDKNKLNAVSSDWLTKRIEELQKKESDALINDTIAEQNDFNKQFRYQKKESETDFLLNIETNQDLIIFYKTILEQYEKKSWIHSLFTVFDRALDSMRQKKITTTAKNVGVAVGNSVVYVPMASMEAFEILSSSVDSYFAANGINLSSKEYLGLKIIIAKTVLLPAAAALTMINNSKMSDEDKRKAKREIMQAVIADAISSTASYQLGVSTDVLKSGDVESIATQALMNQMIQSLTAETGNNYDVHTHNLASSSYTSNVEGVMKRYNSVLTQSRV